jgi:ATPase related to the helicase subunit of the Holliday junction resolvase
MKHFGYGKDYRNVHLDPEAKNEMECLPDKLRGRKYFETDPANEE